MGHDDPTRALDPLELAEASRTSVRVSALELINECARAMATPNQPRDIVMRLKDLVAELTKVVDELSRSTP